MTLGFLITSILNDGVETLTPIIQSLLTLENVEDSFKPFEESIKKHLASSIQITCLLPLAEKFLLEEKTARAAVTFVYILIRLVHKKISSEQKLKDSEAKEIWGHIWKIAELFPRVRTEIQIQEDLNDVSGWKEEIQTQARNKWLYFESHQIPQTNERIELLSKTMKELFGFEDIESDLQNEN